MSKKTLFSVSVSDISQTVANIDSSVPFKADFFYICDPPDQNQSHVVNFTNCFFVIISKKRTSASIW